VLSGKPGAALPCDQFRFHPIEHPGQASSFMVEGGLIRRGVKTADSVEDGRTEFDPGSMAGARQRIRRVQRIGLGLLEEFEDDGGFENHVFRAIAPHAQQRHLAERRDGLEPVRLGGEIDIDPLERHAFLGKRNCRALNVGTEIVADEGKPSSHVTLPRHS